MDLIYKHIGENVRTARKKANITQARMAEVLNVSPSHFSGMECGNKRFSLIQIVTIARYLQIPLNMLLTGLVNDIPDTDFQINTIEYLPARQAAHDFAHLIRNCSMEEIKSLLEICSIFVEQVSKR